MIKNLIKVVKNRVILYMLSRYIIYGMHFVVLMIIASKLGPYNYGIWGFFLMLLSYFSRVNFGIANSTNVVLVQNKSDEKKQAEYVISAIVSILSLAVIIIVIGVLYSFVQIPLFEKYHFGKLFYAVCLIAILGHFNVLFSNIYRVKNKLFELAFYQSMPTICLLITVLLVNDEKLLFCLICAYAVAHLTSLMVFLFRKEIPFGGKIYVEDIKVLVSKGFYLFLYNSCFYLILTTTSSIISYYYPVEEYGMYTFSYSLGHSVLLLLEAFTFVVFPKVMDKFYSSNLEEVKKVLNTIRINYVTLSHGLMYCAFAFFPIFIKLFPAYKPALPALYLTSLAILLYTNSFGYNTFLIARNKEKTTAWISFVSLMCSLLIALVLSNINAPFYSVIFCVMISYFVFAYLCTYYARKLMKENFGFCFVVNEIFPKSLLFPYICGIIIALLQWNYLCMVPLFLFILFNINAIKEIVKTIWLVIVSPKVIDIKR